MSTCAVSPRLAVVLVTVIGLIPAIVLNAGVAQAHQDGCHRWHSCPSDSGSYVCGDTGHSSECGGLSQPTTPKSPPRVVYDVVAPPRPQVTKASVGAGGLVSLRVLAEAGSQLVVKRGDRTIAATTATGESQVVSFRAGTGRHRYRAVATDAAGNSSAAGQVTVTSDAAAPALRALTLTPATSDDSRVGFSLGTEPSARYRLAVDGETVAAGGTGTGAIARFLDLANGSHTVAVTLTDKLGNARTETRTMAVKVPSLTVRAEVAGPANVEGRTFHVDGTPGARGILRIPGVAIKRFTLSAGGADVLVPLADGSYAHSRITLIDNQGRRGVAKVGTFIVDTAPPVLTAALLNKEAQGGRFGARLTAEAGSTVTWMLRDVENKVVARGAYVATSDATQVRQDVGEGAYTLEVVAKDDVGNESRERATLKVAPDPLTTNELVGGIAALALFTLLLILAVWLLWHYREHLLRWGARRKSQREQQRLADQHASAVSAHQARLARFDRESAEHHRADIAWNRRRAELVDLHQAALTATGAAIEGDVVPSTRVKTKRGESKYCTVPGQLIDVRSQQSNEYSARVDHGWVTVTSHRVIFTGAKKREWAFDKLQAENEVGSDATMLKVSNRQKWSGIAYSDAERTRVLLAAAVADARDEARTTVAAVVQEKLRSHDLARPVPPTHPGAPPTPPAELVLVGLHPAVTVG